MASTPLPFLVLDTSAFLSGKPIPHDVTPVVTPGVRGEIEEKGRSGRAFAYQREAGLETREASPESLDRATAAARKTNDLTAMSITDLEVVALALDLAAPLVSDDYRVLNVARALGIDARSAGTRGIRKEWEWTWRCRGCGRFFDDQQKGDECPICGTGVRLVRKK